MGKSQRSKGQRGELKAAAALRPLFPDVERDLNDFHGDRGIDLLNTGNLDIQVKHYKNHVPINKINEIRSKGSRIPVLISWPTNRSDAPMVVLSLADYVRILEDVGEAYCD